MPLLLVTHIPFALGSIIHQSLMTFFLYDILHLANLAVKHCKSDASSQQFRA